MTINSVFATPIRCGEEYKLLSKDLYSNFELVRSLLCFVSLVLRVPKVLIIQSDGREATQPGQVVPPYRLLLNHFLKPHFNHDLQSLSGRNIFRLNKIIMSPVASM